jgi:hypothetical protein
MPSTTYPLHRSVIRITFSPPRDIPPLPAPEQAMLRKPALLGSSLLAALALGACRDQTTAPNVLAPTTPARLSAESPTPSLEGYTTSLLSGAQVFDRLTNVGAPVINPADYSCPASTPVSDWINGKLIATISVEPDRFFQAYDLAAGDVPLYEALLFQSAATEQSFGYTGEHTQDIRQTERQLKSFWDIPSAGIEVVAMHGSTLLDVNRTAATYRVAYAVPADEAAFLADTLRRTLVNSETMRDGNHPYFTFNAVSVAAQPGLWPNKIIVGDGIMAAFDELGFGDVAPKAILAHEYGHQVQFSKHFGLRAPGPERSRYAELNADAMSAYFLTHKRGGTLNEKRVMQFLEVTYDIGDCQFTSGVHHGTPNQRRAAAQFGFALAHEAQKQGHILTADEFQAAFDAVYPSLIAPDAD